MYHSRLLSNYVYLFFFSIRRRHTRCALVTGVQTCALPIYVLGDPLDPDTTLGPVVRLKAAREIRGVIQDAVRQGARNLIDPARFGASQDANAYVAPALLTDVDHTMEIGRAHV